MALFCRKGSLTDSPPQVEVTVKRCASCPESCKPLFLRKSSIRQHLLPRLFRAKKYSNRFASGKWNSVDDVTLHSLNSDCSKLLGQTGGEQSGRQETEDLQKKELLNTGEWASEAANLIGAPGPKAESYIGLLQRSLSQSQGGPYSLCPAHL
ncbi:Hypothetical predicted protein [Pelobates cultripes]|uniref:Uncharacterized protein n=1 Tax=Pelobates cultripes TaxID=61616 RepID=A0AAD1T3N1_PELCU|nr:Hypothetical predicted protein [Pelobates cultripes]